MSITLAVCVRSAMEETEAKPAVVVERSPGWNGCEFGYGTLRDRDGRSGDERSLNTGAAS